MAMGFVAANLIEARLWAHLTTGTQVGKDTDTHFEDRDRLIAEERSHTHHVSSKFNSRPKLSRGIYPHGSRLLLHEKH